MKLQVVRFEFGPTSTVGHLQVDGTNFGYTLERECIECGRKPAIPEGTYDVTVDWSDRFQRDMPHVLNVPGYDGIRIHPGNTDADTEGCILVGQTWGNVDFIGNSRLVFNALFPLMQKALENKEKITLEISSIQKT